MFVKQVLYLEMYQKHIKMILEHIKVGGSLNCFVIWTIIQQKLQTKDTITAHVIDQTKILGYPEVLKLECPESYTEEQRQVWIDSCNMMIQKREREEVEITNDYVFQAAIAKACREQVMYTGQTVGTMPEEFAGFEEDWQRGWNQVLATYYTYATMDRSKQSYTWDEVYQIAVDIAYNPEVRANELNLLAPSCPKRYRDMYDAFQAGWILH